MPSDQQHSHHLFMRALQHEAINCELAGCPGPVETHRSVSNSRSSQNFHMQCERCGWQDRPSPALNRLDPTLGQRRAGAHGRRASYASATGLSVR